MRMECLKNGFGSCVYTLLTIAGNRPEYSVILAICGKPRRRFAAAQAILCRGDVTGTGNSVGPFTIRHWIPYKWGSQGSLAQKKIDAVVRPRSSHCQLTAAFTLGEQLPNHLATVRDLHRPARLAGEGGLQ